MRSSADSFEESSLIDLKDNDWLLRQRKAGRAVSAALTWLEDQVKLETKLSLKDLSVGAEEIIERHECTPTFKGYKSSNGKPFPEAVCISVNRQLVHGIPTDYVLKPGDIVKFDLGATYQGAIADSAISCIFAEPHSSQHKYLIESCQKSLNAAIRSVAVGKRLGVIGNAISRVARDTGFGLVTNYGGHGISLNKPHAPPFVPNRATPDEGIMIVEGLTIAVEPMFTMGVPKTSVHSDGWTVMTEDVGAHWEHSLYVHADHVEVITFRPTDQTITEKVYF